MNTSKLQELKGSNYEIEDGEPNIFGWDVKDESGEDFGDVHDLLFDEASRKVRYIIVDLDGNDFNLKSRKVLVPIGIATLHENDDDVILPGVTASQLELLPEYSNSGLTSDVESQIRNVFAGLGGTAVAGGGFYDHEHFNEQNLYRNRSANASETIPVIKEELQVGKRDVETGGLRLRTRIVENPVEEKINLREEKVRVERTAVNRPANASDIKEESFELTEKTEVPVVAKEARVVEEVSLNKDITEKEEIIRDTVKSTEVDVDRLDKEGKSSRSDI